MVPSDPSQGHVATKSSCVLGVVATGRGAADRRPGLVEAAHSKGVAEAVTALVEGSLIQVAVRGAT